MLKPNADAGSYNPAKNEDRRKQRSLANFEYFNLMSEAVIDAKRYTAQATPVEQNTGMSAPIIDPTAQDIQTDTSYLLADNKDELTRQQQLQPFQTKQLLSN